MSSGLRALEAEASPRVSRSASRTRSAATSPRSASASTALRSAAARAAAASAAAAACRPSRQVPPHCPPLLPYPACTPLVCPEHTPAGCHTLLRRQALWCKLYSFSPFLRSCSDQPQHNPTACCQWCC